MQDSLATFWHYPSLDPVAVSLGPLQIHWYAISYLVGIGLAWFVLKYRVDKDGTWSEEQLSDILFYAVLGILLGGRLGYIFFYGFDAIARDPLSVLRIWEGGMSFHGGFLGVLASLWFYAYRRGLRFWDIMDFIAPAVPLGLGSGRIGNFINTELPGRITDVPWAVVYPGEVVARHPSSLYQAVLEGPVLFLVLWTFSARPKPVMAVSALFVLGYGLLRFFSEFFRAPDAHIGFLYGGWLTMGQVLSLPMVILGIALLAYSYLQEGVRAR